jgi:excisionase family DNA binding protein
LSQRILLKPAEAGELLGIGRSTVYHLIDQGDLPVVRIGRSVRIPVKALHALIDRQLESGGWLVEGVMGNRPRESVPFDTSHRFGKAPFPDRSTS